MKRQPIINRNMSGRHCLPAVAAMPALPLAELNCKPAAAKAIMARLQLKLIGSSDAENQLKNKTGWV